MHTLYVPSTSNNNNPKTRSANKASPVFRRPNLTSSTRTIQTCLGWLKISRATFSPEFSLGTSSFVEARTYINVESESHRWERVTQVRTKVPTHRCNNRRSNLVDSVDSTIRITLIVHAISTSLIELPCLLHLGGMMAVRMTTSGLRTVIRKVTVRIRLRDQRLRYESGIHACRPSRDLSILVQLFLHLTLFLSPCRSPFLYTSAQLRTTFLLTRLDLSLPPIHFSLYLRRRCNPQLMQSSSNANYANSPS